MLALTAVPETMARYLRVPHRAYFSAGALALVLLAGWWALQLALATPLRYPAMQVHALLMPLGVFPLFMLGFIFTAGPRWLGVPAPSGHLGSAIAYLGGLMLALAGFAGSVASPLPGLLLMQAVWTVACLRWLACLLQSQAEDRRHGWRLLWAMGGGAMTLLLAVLWARSGDGRLWLMARQLALWAFLLPVFLTVSHRMLPFFTQSVLSQRTLWRPFWLLDGWLAGCLLLALAIAPGWAAAEAGLAFALAASFGWASLRWGLRASLHVRLLAMLHLSFAWLAPALLLYGLGALGVAVGSAPAHALALGCFATMLVGFVTRVSLGHSGRPLEADAGYWYLYLGLHLTALLRVAVSLLGLSSSWMVAASLAWLALMLAWAARVLPIYARRRADGKVE